MSLSRGSTAIYISHLHQSFKRIYECGFSGKPYTGTITDEIRYVSPIRRPGRSLGRVEVQLYSIFDLGTRRGWGVSVTPRQHLTPGKDPVPIVQEAGWASGPVWTCAENLAPTGIRSQLTKLSVLKHYVR